MCTNMATIGRQLLCQPAGRCPELALRWPQMVLTHNVISAQCSECQGEEVRTSAATPREKL